MLHPDNLEMASQTKIWRSWYATTPLPLKAIGKGFLDDCMAHGLQAPDRIEVVCADGFATLIVGERTSFGVGFALLAERKVAKKFEANQKPQESVKPAAKPPEAPDPVTVITDEDLTPEMKQNGWTPESLATYMRVSEGINAIAKVPT